MDNKILKIEAERIVDELIKISRTDKDLDTIFNELLDKKLKAKSLNVMFYLTNILAEKKYYIDNISPLELKKYNSWWIIFLI